MSDLTANVHWLGVLVGAVLSFVAGWLWYSPQLFGTKWAEGSGVKMGTAGKMPVEAMATQGIGLLLVSWFVNVLHASLPTIILGTLAFVVMGYSGGTFSGKTQYARLVDGGYWIVSVAIMFIVQMVI